MAATKSLVVDFSGGSSSGSGSRGGFIRLEADSDMNVRATPLITDTYYLRLFTHNATNISVEVSHGAANLDSTPKTLEVTETVDFLSSNEGRTQYPVVSLGSVSWLGSSLGTLTPDGVTLTASKSGVGVAQVTYTTTYQSLAVTAPSGIDTETTKDYSIAVVASADEGV